MQAWLNKRILWQLGWAGIALAGALIIVRFDIAMRRESFQTNARIAHGVLSQRAVQHEAILATLVLLGTELGPEKRLPAVYPQVLAVWRRGGDDVWPDPALQTAEDKSRDLGHAALGSIDAANGQYTLVLAGTPSSFALRLDVRRMLTSEDWPLALTGPIRATLEYAGNAVVLQPGEPAESQPTGLTSGFEFDKPLAAVSQPFMLRLSRATGPVEWPWTWLLTWAALSGFAMAALASWRRGRRERHRAEGLLRVGQTARLNALGELAGGIAHELNQPLAAVIANTQAAQRLLDDDPPELGSARQAMGQAAAQGRRAANVLTRLRGLIEAPDALQPRQAVYLQATVRQVLDLLEPEVQRRGIEAVVKGRAPAVLADPVALEQIVHNLLGNAMQALDEVPEGERRLVLTILEEGGCAVLTVRDSGPGIAPEALHRIFEPFYTTRRGGLGLGLSLCETLAHAMDGTLTAHNAATRGAEFRLTLPVAKASS